MNDIDPKWLAQPLVQGILEEYPKATTHRMKAVLEERLWRQASARERKGRKRRFFLHAVLGEPAIRIHRRGSLLPAPDALWDKVEEGLGLSTACGILVRGRKIAHAESLSIEKAVDKAIEEWQAKPTATRADGRVYHRSAPGRAALRGTGESRRRTNPWTRIRTELSGILAARTKGLSELEAGRLLERFEVALKGLIDEFGEWCMRVRRRNEEPPPSRKQVIFACKILCMDPPAPGAKVDLRLAGKQKKRLVRLYHPDLHAGDKTKRELYERVIGAYGVLEAYAEVVGKETENGDDANE
jgi:hypothetical protein